MAIDIDDIEVDIIRRENINRKCEIDNHQESRSFVSNTGVLLTSTTFTSSGMMIMCCTSCTAR
ncbi:MAG: hypothetical protein WA667_20230 [Candidatus Nitrosopolaris sp.]